ncbi:dioxygenase [Polaribacter reichenbachii]|uniref:Dioxygenase n=1 Tax=Polaribacter reichenbachii TaxID=996801 RepID=A0A1B8U2E4_9FLAO|nr:VOC family protein [Polaribacter reichenbachii]APZ47720.1 dioxygenase [Polaribacter reichenbachii]AUC18354.1 dioxygenase [Polaribacter reichenbachii]OBY66036.1 dioxygenase [Polaribacter reichenbachii]
MDYKFHLAFKVKDIKSTIQFYHHILGCNLGRQTEDWVDFDFFGHQLSAHVSNNIPDLDYCGKVDSLKVPIPHFGAIIDNTTFSDVYDRLEKNNLDFIFKPQERYMGKKGAQKTMFILDFSNNPLEFKSFTDEQEIFK